MKPAWVGDRWAVCGLCTVAAADAEEVAAGAAAQAKAEDATGPGAGPAKVAVVGAAAGAGVATGCHNQQRAQPTACRRSSDGARRHQLMLAAAEGPVFALRRPCVSSFRLVSQESARLHLTTFIAHQSRTTALFTFSSLRLEVCLQAYALGRRASTNVTRDTHIRRPVATWHCTALNMSSRRHTLQLICLSPGIVPLLIALEGRPVLIVGIKLAVVKLKVIGHRAGRSMELREAGQILQSLGILRPHCTQSTSGRVQLRMQLGDMESRACSQSGLLRLPIARRGCHLQAALHPDTLGSLR